MAGKKGALGKGLDSLISVRRGAYGSHDAASSAETTDKRGGRSEILMDISMVEPNRSQPRKRFDEESLRALSDSVRMHGVLQPLIVQKKDGYYEIIAGERRWRAAKMAGLSEIPVIVREYTGQQGVEVSLIENIQREDLNPIEEAQAYQRLSEEFSLKQEEIARRVSKSRAAVANTMRLLKLPEDLREKVALGELSAGHARALLTLPEEAQRKLARKIVSEGLSARESEELAKRESEELSGARKEGGGFAARKREAGADNLIREELADRLKQVLGTKVELRRSGEGRGRIEIEYYSREDLERLIDLLLSVG